MMKDGRAMESRPNARKNVPVQLDEPSDASTIGLVRNSTAKATFRRMPESMAEMAEGVLLWASGSQVCMGTKPTLVPTPTNRKTNAQRSVSGESRPAFSRSEEKVNAPAPRSAPPAEWISISTPKRPSVMPVEQMMMYFQ